MSREEKSRQAIAETYAEFVRRLNLPASVGRIVAELLLSSVPLSQAQLRERLSLSEGSVSEGLRQLVGMGYVERAGDPRARPAGFQVRADNWAEPATSTLDNARATYANALRLMAHFEEFGITGPSVELVERQKAMFEVFVAEMPALVQRAVEAGARVQVGRQPHRQAG